jgi:hypothetical protein
VGRKHRRSCPYFKGNPPPHALLRYTPLHALGSRPLSRFTHCHAICMAVMLGKAK